MELAVALVAVVVFYRRARFSVAMMATWLASAVLFGAVDLAFNAWAYGSATSTGYDAGEITFSFSAFWPNLKLMPTQLLSSMPLWTLAAIAVISIGARWVRRRATTSPTRHDASRDLAVARALAAGWLVLWIVYFTYTWTAQMAGRGPGGVSRHRPPHSFLSPRPGPHRAARHVGALETYGSAQLERPRRAAVARTLFLLRHGRQRHCDGRRPASPHSGAPQYAPAGGYPGGVPPNGPPGGNPGSNPGG